MGVSLLLCIKNKIDHQILNQLLIERGYQEYENEEYFWTSPIKYLSTRGVELHVSCDEKYDSIIYTETKADRSYYDFEEQNNVIKSLKKIFGGYVCTGCGSQGYIINDLVKLEQYELACEAAYGTFYNNFIHVEFLVAEESDKYNNILEVYDSNPSMKELVVKISETPILQNNILLPFMISCFESFLRDFLTRFVEYNETANNKLFEKSKVKLTLNQVREIQEGNKSVIDFAFENTSFQNLHSANKSYIEFMNVDILKVLDRKKKIGGRFYNVKAVLFEALELRHRIIHEAYIDISLTKDAISIYKDIIRLAVNFIIDHCNSELGMRIEK